MSKNKQTKTVPRGLWRGQTEWSPVGDLRWCYTVRFIDGQEDLGWLWAPNEETALELVALRMGLVDYDHLCQLVGGHRLRADGTALGPGDAPPGRWPRLEKNCAAAIEALSRGPVPMHLVPRLVRLVLVEGGVASELDEDLVLNPGAPAAFKLPGKAAPRLVFSPKDLVVAVAQIESVEHVPPVVLRGAGTLSDAGLPPIVVVLGDDNTAWLCLGGIQMGEPKSWRTIATYAARLAHGQLTSSIAVRSMAQGSPS